MCPSRASLPPPALVLMAPLVSLPWSPWQAGTVPRGRPFPWPLAFAAWLWGDAGRRLFPIVCRGGNGPIPSPSRDQPDPARKCLPKCLCSPCDGVAPSAVYSPLICLFPGPVGTIGLCRGLASPFPPLGPCGVGQSGRGGCCGAALEQCPWEGLICHSGCTGTDGTWPGSPCPTPALLVLPCFRVSGDSCLSHGR